jgi:phosphatidylglycerophosphate synthase
MKNSGLNVINLLILLVFIILIRDVIVLYLWKSEKENYYQSTKLDDFSTLFSFFMLIVTVYLVRKFTFSNKFLLLTIYFLLVKSFYSIFNYFQKKYNFLGLDTHKIQRMEQISRRFLIISSGISILITFYIIYFIYFNN